LITSSVSVFAGARSWLLLNHFHHLSFDSFFFKHQPVLVPNEVWDGWIDIMASHASCKLIDNKFVIWILSETKFFAVVEHLAKALWVVFSQSFDGDLHLLLLDVSVFFSL